MIIGGGAAAFAAAIKAEGHAVKTAMIEKHILGGTCVNVGCIPSKNLLGAGEIINTSRHPPYPSVFPCDQNFDFAATIGDKDNLVKSLRNEKYYDVMSGFGYVDFIEGAASFVSDTTLRVNGNKIESDKFIIATGASPFIPAIKGLDAVDYLTNVEALSLRKKPLSMIIIGGRALGLEFAQMYSRFGTHITLLQRSNRIIPDHEPEISEKLNEYLGSEGIEIITEVEIKETYQKGNKIMSSNIRITSTFHNPKYAECIEACNHCANSCEYCGSLCLKEDSVKMLLKCIELCFYCADVCRFASKYMSCDSTFAKEICQYCSKVCNDCAKECEKHDMDHCRKCAVVCNECSKICQEMAGK